MDRAALAEIVRGPGVDTRQWVSFGTVDAGEDLVEFDDDEGAPLVNVTLQPSKVPVRCRVASFAAGDGEGEWHPFVAGDQVIVAIPAGNERDCVIVGRLNSSLAPFPSGSVAGQDPKTNSFAFTRRRTAHVAEYAGPYLVRQATSGALLSIDAAGAVTIRDGQKGALQMSADLFGYQSGDAKCLLQIDLTGERFTLQVNDALLSLSGSGASPQANAIVAPGALSIATSGNPAAEHVATAEAVAGLLTQLLLAIGTASPGPIIGAALGGAAPAIVATAITAAGQIPLLPPVAAAVAGAFAAALQKPAGVPGQGQLKPGLGAAGLLVG